MGETEEEAFMVHVGHDTMTDDDKALRAFGRTVFIGFTLIGIAVWFFGGSYDATRDSDALVWGPLP